jgi:hypothetical protein
MHRMAFRTLTLLIVVSWPGVAPAQVIRCESADGAVTYQQEPCRGSERESRPAIPTTFPPVNDAERDRLLAREAALDRRLEARRDRESREAIARAERQAREAERARVETLAAAEPPPYLIAYPYWRPAYTARVVRHAVPHMPRPTPPIFR